ncbi:MAG: hypothetical protein JXA73_08505 [Acidobacteria bacterium]|nr:hypothetical protein [Acidobacteriota bacterium]
MVESAEMEMQQTAIDLICMIGSPFYTGDLVPVSDQKLIEVFNEAFKNRVALLLLSKHRKDGWDPWLEDQYNKFKEREATTRIVARDVGLALNDVAANEFVVFKSIKPFPATPNDTDVLFFGKKSEYERAYDWLIKKGYRFHEWAPMQRTVYDPRGVGQIGKGKKGGTYYIDFYEDIATDYFSYMNKNRLREFVVAREIEGGVIPLLRPEPELAIVLFHSVFPERTYQLEHFYLPLYVLAAADFDLETFFRVVRNNGMKTAVSSSLGITQELHQRALGVRVARIDEILGTLGPYNRDLRNFRVHAFKTPYMFSVITFIKAFAEKLKDPYSCRSLGRQLIKMFDPRFAWDVFTSLKNRLSERGVYHQE